MEWTAEQDRALSEINGWLKRKDSPRFALGGYAGTGKTTLARRIAEDHGGEVMFGAFTGKAASVLRSKGCPNATTIHKLIYQPRGRSGREEIQELEDLIQRESAKSDPDKTKLATWRRELEKKTSESSAMFEKKSFCEVQGADLVIIDESSMVDRRIGKDLESFGVPILYLGDPGQLPPVKGKAHLLERDYDFVLEQIHRQAADNPIIWLSNEIRHGNKVKFGEFGGLVKLQPKSKWCMDTVLNADQVITGMNASRFGITRRMREELGFNQIYPLANDKLICCQNDHDVGLLNGVTCNAIREGEKRGNILRLDIKYDRRSLDDVICDAGLFQQNYEARTHFPKGEGVQKFDYGYCITGHKAQGSQWRHVIIADDKMRVNDRLQRRRWLYTAFTRAEEKVNYYV